MSRPRLKCDAPCTSVIVSPTFWAFTSGRLSTSVFFNASASFSAKLWCIVLIGGLGSALPTLLQHDLSLNFFYCVSHPVNQCLGLLFALCVFNYLGLYCLLQSCRAFFETSNLYRFLPHPLLLKAMLLCIQKKALSLGVFARQH